MKKKFLLGLAFAALAAGGCFLAGNSNSIPRHQFTPDEIANIEALTQNESGAIVVVGCKSMRNATCYVFSNGQLEDKRKNQYPG